MKTFALFFSLLFVQFSIFSQQTINGTIMHDGLQREYMLFVPSAYNTNTAVPLVFCFHGHGDTAANIMSYTNFHLIADTANFIVIYPQGTLFQGNSHWNVASWSAGSNVDDVGFINSLLDSISNAYNIDSTRVYCTGMSNGGFMSFLLACQLSDKIAAIASVAGSMSMQTQNACNPLHPTPVLQIHGDADNSIPYNGNTWSKSINDMLQYWINHNNCNASPTTIAVPDINQFDGSTAEYIIYDGGDNGTTVEHFKVIGGGHDWPGVWGNMDFKATNEILRFFSKYDINGLIGNAGSGDIKENVTQIRIYPNPTNSHVLIKGDFSTPMEFEIVSILGERLMTGIISFNNQKIDLSYLSPNIYFLKFSCKTFKILKVD
ncbi:PHB depolymerase family esterase [Bacteroidota bacterium]